VEASNLESRWCGATKPFSSPVSNRGGRPLMCVRSSPGAGAGRRALRCGPWGSVIRAEPAAATNGGACGVCGVRSSLGLPPLVSGGLRQRAFPDINKRSSDVAHVPSARSAGCTRPQQRASSCSGGHRCNCWTRRIKHGLKNTQNLKNCILNQPARWEIISALNQVN
jgi:hypothetical protein